MGAIYKREMRTYFHGIVAYVFCIFLLFFVGLYSMIYCLKAQYPRFEYVLSASSFIFMIAVPILTMRVFSEEKRQHTDQLLYSLPIKISGIVMGKHLALLTILAVPMIVMCAYPLILSLYGAVNLKLSYAALFGFYLMGGTLISIGLFISSMTENQATTATVSFLVLLSNYFINSLTDYMSASNKNSLLIVMGLILLIAIIIHLLLHNYVATIGFAVVGEIIALLLYLFNSDSFSNLIPTVLAKMSVFTPFNEIMSGIISLSTLVFYLSISSLMIFFTVQVMEKRRWS